MICPNCNEFRPLERTGLCATCAHAIRKAERTQAPKDKAPIEKVSVKMGKQLSKYTAEKAKWIKDKKCAVYPELMAEDIHHMCGKVSYHDEWARENDIPLLMDKRFWLPVSRIAHIKITDNSKWASENGYTFLRVTDPVFRVLK